MSASPSARYLARISASCSSSRARLHVGGQPAHRDANVRDKLADWYVQSKGLEYTKMRTLTALSRGQMPGPESSIYKAVSAVEDPGNRDVRARSDGHAPA